MKNLNRRELLLLGAASALPTIIFPTTAQASLPPSSLRYLLFIANGLYHITDLLYVKLPSTAGVSTNYTSAAVSSAFNAIFVYTGRTGVSSWHMLTNAPEYQWYEFLDLRSGLYTKIWRGDRLEAKFVDGSRVKVRFNGPDSIYRFSPIRGTERTSSGTLQYGGMTGERDYDGCRRTRSCKGDGGGGGVIEIRPSSSNFLWSWSSQETPW